jgi:hypothetical protein
MLGSPRKCRLCVGSVLLVIPAPYFLPVPRPGPRQEGGKLWTIARIAVYHAPAIVIAIAFVVSIASA